MRRRTQDTRPSASRRSSPRGQARRGRRLLAVLSLLALVAVGVIALSLSRSGSSRMEDLGRLRTRQLQLQDRIDVLDLLRMEIVLSSETGYDDYMGRVTPLSNELREVEEQIAALGEKP